MVTLISGREMGTVPGALLSMRAPNVLCAGSGALQRCWAGETRMAPAFRCCRHSDCSPASGKGRKTFLQWHSTASWRRLISAALTFLGEEKEDLILTSVWTGVSMNPA